MDSTSPFPLYISSTGILTSIGGKSEQVYAATRAGISSFSAANYHTRDHQNVVLARVPDETLAPLSDRLNLGGKLSFRDKRLLRMSLTAAQAAVTNNLPKHPVPLILSVPEHYQGFDNGINPDFLNIFTKESAIPFDLASSRLIHTGRTGVIEAIKIAGHLLQSNDISHVLVGGVDSCQNGDYISHLDKDHRIKANRLYPEKAEDVFIPGEGAGFLLLTRQPLLAMGTQSYRIRIEDPGFSQEPGHFYSSTPCRGEGLDQSVKQALAQSHKMGGKVQRIFSTMNGEHFWAKEFGVTLTRNQAQFSEQVKIEHPAEYYGDIGAAAGAGLIQLAQLDLLLKAPGKALVCTSSDHGFRASVCMTSEAIAA
jgi:3-oxoacyl-[acyl-carrier-protein] synthase-1